MSHRKFFGLSCGPLWPRVMLSLVLCLGVGCESESARLSRRTVSLSDVPENVMTAAQSRLPDVEFADSWKNVDKEGKLHSFEIRGRNKNGKIREARISPSGEVLEVE